jgi:cytochrome oxidase Cu insertion factor (SCO1/SenC/PrrC family)
VVNRLLMPIALAVTAAALGSPGSARAQQAAAPNPLLEVGTVAPDFTLPGATRYGALQQPVRLSDYRGKTVVVAFFYRVRSPG